MAFTKIKTGAGRQAQLNTHPGMGENQQVRAGEFNDLVDALNDLDAETVLTVLAALADPTALGDYADDAAAAIGGVAVGGFYRTTSTLKVRVA